MDDQIRVLIVDDEESILKAIKRLFIDSDYEIITATSAEKGLEHLRISAPIQVVVSDFNMPGLNGVEFLNIVCSQWPDTVRILLSGQADVRAIVDAINEGQIYKFLFKPWERSELENVIADAIDRYMKKKEERRLAQELEARNEKLQAQLIHTQKMESIGRLAGGVAHDFNNIISVIIGFSEVTLKELPEGSTIRDNIQTIHGAGERAAALTRQLLAFSRKQILEVQPININSVMKNMMKMLKRLIPENVTFEFNSRLNGHMILADTSQLEQVLLNLVVNARDAMPGGGRLIINTDKVNFSEKVMMDNENITPGSYVMLSVTDTGTGMSEEVVNNIFDPFFTTKVSGKGTGLGLATVYGIVKQHKGYIAVKSEPERGATFMIYFPVAEGVADQIVEDTAVKAIRGNETILVVDDEPMVLKVVVNMLKPLGYRILEASSGEEGLRVCEEFKDEIDLLLTDVIMTGMNGKELADTLKIMGHETKVIFMSGYTDDALAHHGVLDEGLVLIPKPVTEKIMASKIREVLDQKDKRKPVVVSPVETDELRILLVDDDDDIRILITCYLKDAPCRIDTAENGKIALEKFKSGRYDVLLMDMQMPIMDGLTAVTEIRAWEAETLPRKTAIIALTGNASQEDIDRCISAGYDTHLSKPVKKEKLLSILQECSLKCMNNSQ